MVTRVKTPDRSWARVIFALYAENTTMDELTERLNQFSDGGGLLKPEVSQLQFDSNGPVCMWLLRPMEQTNAPADQQLTELLSRLDRSTAQLQDVVAKGALAEFSVCVLGDDFAVRFE